MFEHRHIETDNYTCLYTSRDNLHTHVYCTSLCTNKMLHMLNCLRLPSDCTKLQVKGWVAAVSDSWNTACCSQESCVFHYEIWMPLENVHHDAISQLSMTDTCQSCITTHMMTLTSEHRHVIASILGNLNIDPLIICNESNKNIQIWQFMSVSTEKKQDIDHTKNGNRSINKRNEWKNHFNQGIKQKHKKPLSTKNILSWGFGLFQMFLKNVHGYIYWTKQIKDNEYFFQTFYAM